MVFFPSLCLFTAERARVGLTTLPGMKGTDYINASYIMVRPRCLSLCPFSLCLFWHFSMIISWVNSKWQLSASSVCVMVWASQRLTAHLCHLRVTTGVMSSSLPSILCPTPPQTSGGWFGTITLKLLSCCLTTKAWYVTKKHNNLFIHLFYLSSASSLTDSLTGKIIDSKKKH